MIVIFWLIFQTYHRPFQLKNCLNYSFTSYCKRNFFEVVLIFHRWLWSSCKDVFGLPGGLISEAFKDAAFCFFRSSCELIPSEVDAKRNTWHHSSKFNSSLVHTSINSGLNLDIDAIGKQNAPVFVFITTPWFLPLTQFVFNVQWCNLPRGRRLNLAQLSKNTMLPFPLDYLEWQINDNVYRLLLGTTQLLLEV